MNHPPTIKRPTRRARDGRYLPGTRGGPGNPNVRAVTRFRRRLLDCITDEDLQQIARVLLAAAKRGEPWAVQEVFRRCFGKAPHPALLPEPEPPDPRAPLSAPPGTRPPPPPSTANLVPLNYQPPAGRLRPIPY